MALALMVAFLYGGLVWGVLPIQPGVSWESHLLGAVAGIFAAVMYYKVDLPPRKVLPDYHPTDIPHLPYWKYEVEGGIKSEYQHSTGPKVKIQYHYKGQSSDAPDTIAPPKESPGSDDNP